MDGGEFMKIGPRRVLALAIVCLFTWLIIEDFTTEAPDMVATKILRPVDLSPHIVWAGQFVPDKVVYHVVGGRFGDGFCVEVSPT